jgi:RimJ/RimL family protein N-acetyltransferase
MKPTFSTPRIVLRAHRDDDLPALLALDTDPAVRRYVDLLVPPDGAFVGWFHLRPPRADTPQEPGDLELGYRLRQDAWGRGLATEGARLLVDHGFTTGAPRVTASALVANGASIRVMEKVGMRRVCEWTYRSKAGAALPAVLCGVTRAEWKQAHAAG